MIPSLRRGTAWIVFGQAVYAVCQWAAIVILARLAGAGAVGVYALAFAVTAPLIIFGNLQLRQVLVTDAAERYAFGDYATVRFSTTLLAVLATVLVAWLGGYDRTTATVVTVIGIAKAFESFSDLLYGLNQRRDRLDLVGQSLALRGIAGLTAFATSYVLSTSVIAAAAALALAWALVLLLFDHRVTGAWRLPQDAAPVRSKVDRARAWFQLIRFGLPLGITLMLISLNTNTPRYFVQAYLGSEGLGIYAAMGHFLIAGNLVVTALGQAASARLADRFASGERVAFRKLLGQLLLLSGLIGLGGVVVALLMGRWILRAFYGDAFSVEADIFIWMMLIGTVSYPASVLGYGLTAMRVFRPQPIFLAMVVVVNVMGCYLLVPHHGLIGAIGAWAVAMLSQGLLFSVAIWRCLSSYPGGPEQRAPAIPAAPERCGRR